MDKAGIEKAFEKIASDYVMSEVNYYRDEYEWPLPQCLVMVEDMAEDAGDKKTLLNLHRVFVDCGRYVELSAEAYEHMQVLGGRKNQIHPLVDGKRWDILYTNEQFEEIGAG